MDVARAEASTLAVSFDPWIFVLSFTNCPRFLPPARRSISCVRALR
jgi:hypothetical protein